MSLSLGTEADAQVATGVAGAHWLVEMDFAEPVGTLYFTTAPVPEVAAGGHTYLGARGVSVGMVQESEVVSARQVVVGFPMGDDTLGLVLTDATEYRRRPVRLYLQLFDAAFAPVLSRRHRWTGRMEPARVGPRGGRVEVPCSRSGLPHARAYQGLRHTHAQQLARYPGNMALQYLQDLIDKPTLWLSKRFQELP